MRSTPREFDLGIPLQISCSLSPSLGFTESWLRLRKKGLLPAILLQGGQLDASADQSEEIHIEPSAYMDDFSLPVISDTAAELLPRVALATQVTMETAREHGLQLNMASNKMEAVVDFRGKGRQQVLEDLSRESPVVDGQWTPTMLRRASRSGW